MQLSERFAANGLLPGSPRLLALAAVAAVAEHNDPIVFTPGV
jgi:hypothetical protein